MRFRLKIITAAAVLLLAETALTGNADLKGIWDSATGSITGAVGEAGAAAGDTAQEYLSPFIPIEAGAEEGTGVIALSDIPEWDGKAYTEVNGNRPSFTKEEKAAAEESFTKYRKLDRLGRARAAYGSLSTDTVNYGEREPIGMIRPSGWHTVKYPGIIKDRYLYNRSHLLMQAAAAGDDPEKCNSEANLITGTRYMNVDGMYTWESRMLDYIMGTGNHALYRVTPIYEGGEPVARGVQMEAWSVEDRGKGLSFNVFCYNVQPGIKIDYATGESSAKANPEKEMEKALKNGSTSVAQ